MRRGRLAIGIALLVLALLLAAGVFLVYRLLSPERFTDLLRDQAAAVGLEVQLDSPARPTIWPHLAVRVDGMHVRRSGASEPMLDAARMLLVVPWRSLLQGDARIEKLHIASPRIDLGQVSTWVASLDEGENTKQVVELPTIEAGVHITDATVLNDRSLLLKALDLDTGTLKPGKVFHLQLHALDASDRPLAVQINTVPTPDDAGVWFDPLELQMAMQPPTVLALSGKLHWSGGLELGGVLDGDLSLASGQYTGSINWLPPAVGEAGDGERPMQITLDGEGGRLDLVLDPEQVLDWWQQVSADTATALSVPPLQGSVSADQLDLGPMQIKGLRVESISPAAATSAPVAADSEP